MLDETILEQRLVTLEAAVSDLQHKLEEKPTSKNWLERLIGSVSDEATFHEALEYGRAFRQADKPSDDGDVPDAVPVSALPAPVRQANKLKHEGAE